MNKKSGHLASGLAIGTILGIAAGFFIQSKEGKKLSKDAQKKALRLQKDVMKKLEDTGDLTKETYAELVDKILASYVKGKDIAQKEIPEVRKFLLSRWKQVEEQLTNLTREEDDEA